MSQIVIDTEAKTIAIDGSEPQQFESMEQVCELLEKMGGAEESPQAGQAEGGEGMSEDQAMQAGFSGVRGGGLGA